MRDPFRSNSNAQLIREAQIGLSVVAILLVLFVYVAFYRISGRGAIPEHVRMAAASNRLGQNNDSRVRSPDTTRPPNRDPFSADRSPVANLSREEEASPLAPSDPLARSNSVAQSSFETKRDLHQPPQLPAAKIPADDGSMANEDSEFQPPGSFRRAAADNSNQLADPSQSALPEIADRVETNISELEQAASRLRQITSQATLEMESDKKIAPEGGSGESTANLSSRSFAPPVPSNSKVVDDPFEIRLPARKFSAGQLASSSQAAEAGDQSVAQPSTPLISGQASTSLIPDPSNDNGSAQPTITSPKPNRRQFAESGKHVNDLRQPIQLNQLRAPAKNTNQAFQPETLHPISKSEAESEKTQPENDFQPLPTTPIPKSSRDPDPDTSDNSFAIGDAMGDGVSDSSSVPEVDPTTSPANELSFSRVRPVVDDPPLQQTQTTMDRGDNESTAQARSTTYRVQPGDSFWSIAESCYGDGRFFRALFKCNEETATDFDNLVPGTTIQTPTTNELVLAWPELCPGPECDSEYIVEGTPGSTASPKPTAIYRTREGDTLFEIARQRLGQAYRYYDIQCENSAVLPPGVNHLTPLPGGIQLTLPRQ